MAEKPFDYPEQSLEWATSGTKTEPSAGTKSTGWVSGGARPAVEFNWRWDAMDQWLQWLQENGYPRRFSSASEAIDAIEPGQSCRLERVQDWDDGDLTKLSGGAEHICSDGRFLFCTTDALELKTFDADAANTSPVPYWSVDLISHGFASVSEIQTDGQTVCVKGLDALAGDLYVEFLISAKGFSSEEVGGFPYDFSQNDQIDLFYIDEIDFQGYLVALKGSLSNLSLQYGSISFTPVSIGDESGIVWADGWAYSEAAAYPFELDDQMDLASRIYEFSSISTDEMALSVQWLWYIDDLGALKARPLKMTGFEIFDRVESGTVSGNTIRLLKKRDTA